MLNGNYLYVYSSTAVSTSSYSYLACGLNVVQGGGNQLTDE